MAVARDTGLSFNGLNSARNVDVLVVVDDGKVAVVELADWVDVERDEVVDGGGRDKGVRDRAVEVAERAVSVGMRVCGLVVVDWDDGVGGETGWEWGFAGRHEEVGGTAWVLEVAHGRVCGVVCGRGVRFGERRRVVVEVEMGCVNVDVVEVDNFYDRNVVVVVVRAMSGVGRSVKGGLVQVVNIVDEGDGVGEIKVVGKVGVQGEVDHWETHGAM